MADNEIQNAVIRHARDDMANVPGASQLRPEAQYASAGELARDVGKGVLKAVGEAVDRLVPQGRDELANFIFHADAYWPGVQPPSLTVDEPPPPDEPGVSYAEMLERQMSRGMSTPDRGMAR